MVEYKYNAWSAQLSRTGELANTLGYANPFRYRGYIYDDETWMYWLRSRYYYPELHRFISADSTLNGIGPAANIYCYCNNNPTRFVDTNGCAGESVTPVPTIFPTPAPSRSLTWDEDFEQRVFFSAAGSYYYGEPNSYRAWQNSKGEWYERWYGDDGTPIMDRHWSDHGNAKRHPFVPHDEDWKDDGKGGKTLDSKSSRPSPEGVKKPTKETPIIKFSTGGTPNGVRTALSILLALGVLVLSGGAVNVPTGAFA